MLSISNQEQQAIVKAYFLKKISKQKMLQELDKLDGKNTAKSKYLNKKIEINGYVFDSQKEADYYCQLKLLQKAGEVKKIELQPEFELLPKFTKNNITYQPIIYKADFKVTYLDGHTEIIDVKGSEAFRTQVYRIKKKMFEYQYPDLTIKEIYWKGEVNL